MVIEFGNKFKSGAHALADISILHGPTSFEKSSSNAPIILIRLSFFRFRLVASILFAAFV